MGFQAVIFDMDGVIVDTEPVYKRTAAALLKKLKLHVSESALDEYAGVDSMVMWQDITKRYGLAVSPQELHREENKMMEAYYRNGALKAITPTLALIKKVWRSGYRMAVASSSERLFIEHVLERLRIGRCFEAVVSRNDVGSGKPCPDIYLLAARLLHLSPHECVVIEDSAAGTAAAKAAGMKVIRYVGSGEYEQGRFEADLNVKDMRDITIKAMQSLAASS